MHLPAQKSLATLASSGKLFIELFAHGTLNVEIYKPGEKDLQKPHDRDEVYVVIAGTGEFISGSDTVSFNAGDFLFVPAGVEHRFINYADDFSVWVIFYGPKGGENKNLHV